ncbi:MAG: helix-turn-helix domain-containing protein [Rhodovibrionaceae bacterium]|nr:helix-turn-helix domain-containing protein [Rhodovibrionaceae bacterium]
MSGKRQRPAYGWGTGRADPVDLHVGRRIRALRLQQGMSQERMAEALGVTFQQIQKYERGSNRIGASRLFDVAQALDVPVSHFYAGFDETALEPSDEARPRDPGGLSEAAAGYDISSRKQTQALALVEAYYSLADAQLRRRLFDMTRALASPAARRERN